MQKIKLISDAPSDIPSDIAKKNDIEILPIPIVVDDNSYLEGVDFTPREFYDVLVNAKSLPVTSHITAITFYDKFETSYNEGYTHVVVVTINSKGSATFDAAMLARKNFYNDHPDLEEKFPIVVIDSGTYSLGYGYPVIKAAQLIATGAPVADAISLLEDMLSRVEVMFTIFTLEYAKKSGRIKTAAAFVGEVLGFRPIMHIKNSEISTIGKVRGNAPAMEELLKRVVDKRSGDNSEYILLGGADKDVTESFQKMARKSLGKDCSGVYDIGPSIAINAGVKLVGLVYFGNDKNTELKHKKMEQGL